MASNRMSAAILLVAASVPGLAATTPWSPTPDCSRTALDALYALELLQADAVPPYLDYRDSVADPSDGATIGPRHPRDRRELLAAFAMTLRDVRYRYGGRTRSTGFDCSGFVQYVFAQTLGVDLPDDSASQFRSGRRVARSELRTGDLVFFRTRGERVSHVGIYLDHGRFIHSPSPGKRVRVDDLRDPYWSQRFAGAKRPAVLT